VKTVVLVSVLASDCAKMVDVNGFVKIVQFHYS